MDILLLTTPGLESLAAREMQELFAADTQLFPQLVRSALPAAKEVVRLAYHAQAIRRIALPFAQWKERGKFRLLSDFMEIASFFPAAFPCRIDVELVHGQEKRSALFKKVVQEFFPLLEKEGKTAVVDYRRPALVLVVIPVEKEYLLCLDPGGVELNSRGYRLFAHQASFKGDLGYFFVRASRFQRGEKLLVGFSRDGVLAIEAALYAAQRPVHTPERTNFLFKNSPLFQDILSAESLQPLSAPASAFPISAFDSSLPNLKAAKKNARLAGVTDCIEITKCQLEDLELRFAQNAFDRLIFHITSKDEERLNELYYQAKALLKKGGTLLLISRDKWDPTFPEEFTLLSRELFKRGDSALQWIVLEKTAEVREKDHPHAKVSHS